MNLILTVRTSDVYTSAVSGKAFDRRNLMDVPGEKIKTFLTEMQETISTKEVVAS